MSLKKIPSPESRPVLLGVLQMRSGARLAWSEALGRAPLSDNTAILRASPTEESGARRYRDLAAWSTVNRSLCIVALQESSQRRPLKLRRGGFTLELAVISFREKGKDKT